MGGFFIPKINVESFMHPIFTPSLIDDRFLKICLDRGSIPLTSTNCSRMVQVLPVVPLE